MINVAVIGVGYWGKKIVHEYMQLTKKVGDLNVGMVCDLAEENLGFCEKNYGTTCVTKNYWEVMSRPEINAVHVCTPNETHYDICKAALQTGKHVLTEKPMTLDSNEAYELVNLAQARNKVLSVGHIFRFNNALRKVKDLLQGGFMGDIYHLRLAWTTRCPPLKRREVITDLAPHPFDILNFLLGKWPSAITCKAKAYRRKKLEEMAYIIAEFTDNVIAHIELSWLLPGKRREVQIVGSKGCLQIDCLAQVIDAFRNGRLSRIDVEKNNTIETELSYFVDCIQNNEQGNNEDLNENSGLFGAKVVELLEKSRESLEKRKTVNVEGLNE